MCSQGVHRARAQRGMGPHVTGPSRRAGHGLRIVRLHSKLAEHWPAVVCECCLQPAQGWVRLVAGGVDQLVPALLLSTPSTHAHTPHTHTTHHTHAHTHPHSQTRSRAHTHTHCCCCLAVGTSGMRRAGQQAGGGLRTRTTTHGRTTTSGGKHARAKHGPRLALHRSGAKPRVPLSTALRCGNAPGCRPRPARARVHTCAARGWHTCAARAAHGWLGVAGGGPTSFATFRPGPIFITELDQIWSSYKRWI